MTKKNNGIIAVIFIALALVLVLGINLGSFAVINGNEITRSVPSTVQPGSTFTVSYVATSSGTWGASIVDSISGGCTFPSGSSEYKSVMLSTDGNTKQIQVTAPQSGSCSFTGDFKFGSDAIGNMDNSIVVISSGGGSQVDCTSGQTKCEETIYFTCLSGSWSSQGEVDGLCGYSAGNGNGGGETPTIDLNKILFYLPLSGGDFGVTIMHLLILLVSLFLIKIVFSK